jgi:hypothetical protein
MLLDDISDIPSWRLWNRIMESSALVRLISMPVRDCLTISGQQARQIDIWIDDHGSNRQGLGALGRGVQGRNSPKAICCQGQGEVSRVSQMLYESYTTELMVQWRRRGRPTAYIGGQANGFGHCCSRGQTCRDDIYPNELR